MLKCGICGNEFDDDVALLSDHFSIFHPSCDYYNCGQNNCRKSYLQKRSLIRHIKADHLDSEEDGEGSCSSTGTSVPSASGCNNVNVGSTLASDVEVSMEVVEDDPAEVTLQSQAERMIMELRAAKLTGEAVTKVIELTTSLLQSHLNSVKEELQPKLQDAGLPSERVSEILGTVNVPNIFKGLKDIESQLKYFNDKYGVPVPEEKYLGYRIDKRLDPYTNLFVQTQVPESFQYVSVIDSLKLILSKASTREKVMNAKPSEDGILRSHLDGEMEFMRPTSSNEIVVHLILYHDDLEVANALGSKTSIHKLGAFLFQILDLPNEDLAELSSIHLIALAYSEDLKKDDAFKTVLSPFVSDMKKLAIGVPVVFEGVSYTLKSQVVDFSADSLAAHAALGLLSCSAKCFCRMCLITREELRRNANDVGAPRTLELHQQHVELVKVQRKFRTQCGVQRDNALSELPFFDFTKQTVFDIFHDILEGVAAMDIKLVLREFVLVRKLLSVQTFNENVASFSYGLLDMRNKPSANFTEEMLHNASTSGKLKQTGSQTWCLLRAFQFLLGEALPDAEQDQHMKLIFLMQDIAQIIFSYAIRPSDIEEVEKLIERHHDLFKILFVDPSQIDDEPDEDGEEHSENELDVDDPAILDFSEEEGNQEESVPEDEAGREKSTEESAPQQHQKKKKKKKKVHNYNKMHHEKHYGQLMKSLGPLVRFWCAKFEGRLKIFRQFASICNCFKNIPKTMARMFQLSTMSSILGESACPLLHHKGKIVTVSDTAAYSALLGAGFQIFESLLSTNSATLNGVEYRPGLFVCISNKPEFGIIEDVFVWEETRLILVVRKWKNEGKSTKFNSYHVTSTDDSASFAVDALKLAHVRPLAPWTSAGSSNVYLALKTIIV